MRGSRPGWEIEPSGVGEEGETKEERVHVYM